MHVRINTLRVDDELTGLMAKKFGLEGIEWYPQAFSTDHAGISKAVEYQRGYFYIQSLSSMVPVIVLDPRPGERVLDMAAAPGSKATQAAIHMGNEGILIANDSSYMRLKSLGSHIDRLGITCIAVSNYDGCRFPGIIEFDRVLVDAPCSSMGSRKGTISFSENRIRSLARIQKSMLIRAFGLLKRGGTLVYSTCTKTVEENENVIAHLLDKRSNAEMLPINLPFHAERGECGDERVDLNVRRLELDEYFFVSKITKSGLADENEV